MTLYEMLDKCVYYQKVWIFAINCYDQNKPVFKGNVGDARCDANVWEYLMCEVDVYECKNGILDIKVMKKCFEAEYPCYEDRWTDRSKRPWLYSSEVESDWREVKYESN